MSTSAPTFQQVDLVEPDHQWILDVAFLVAPTDGTVKLFAEFQNAKESQFAAGSATIKSTISGRVLPPLEDYFQNPSTLRIDPPPINVGAGEILMFTTWRTNRNATQVSWALSMKFTEGNRSDAMTLDQAAESWAEKRRTFVG